MLRHIEITLATKQAQAQFHGQNEKGQFTGELHFGPAENIEGYEDILAGISEDMAAFTPAEGENRKVRIKANLAVEMIEGGKARKINLEDPEIEIKETEIAESIKAIKTKKTAIIAAKQAARE